MKGSCSSGEVEIKQKYVFFSNPETVSEHAEKSRGILCNQQSVRLKQQEPQCASQRVLGNLVDSSSVSNPKYVESFAIHKTVQPHPFTFITAVKRKLALAAYNETSKKVYNIITTKATDPLNIKTNNIDGNTQESLYQTIQKMNFIKPLKVPDVKISPKTLDYASKETNLRDLTSTKVSTTLPSQKMEKVAKSVERAHRKLDFSLSEGHSFVSSDDIEPLRAPDLSISPSLTKQKEQTRDNSREKENRIKRMKKDDCLVSKSDEMSQDVNKRVKNPKHVSRRDVTETKRLKNERTLISSSKDGEFTSKKPKSKNFATSTLRKDEEKRIRSSSGINTMTKSRDRSLESSRGRTFSSESLSDRNTKFHEKSTSRDQSRGITTDSDVSILKYNDDYQILNALRHIDEQKQKSIVDAKTPKTLGRSSSQLLQQKSIEISGKEQHKRIQERIKATTSKTQIRCASSASEILDDMENPLDSSVNKNRNVELPQQSRNKILDPSDFHQSANIVAKSSNDASSDDIVLDPVKISFRDDSYSQQDEFCDLVTPDINLTLRSKRRKQQASTTDTDQDNELKTPKHRVRTTETPENMTTPISHPTALHMQFQAELHLFDSYNESLRQVMNVEKCLYNVKNDRDKEHVEKQKLTNDEIKKHSITMQPERDSVDDTITPTGQTVRLRDDEKNTNDSTKFAGKETEMNCRKNRQESETRENKSDAVRVAEVQTQTANDIATQTEARTNRHSLADRVKQYPGVTYERGDFGKSDIAELSLGSLEQFENLDHIEDISLPSKMRTMSEISLHETTSSIKTETGTEISISTRDVTCSFNKYLDLEMAQLIKDEKLMYDKIEMLFKSREKTLNDRTKKLVKLEEQKRALRDTGQDSRISSVKKKQRALLLKLQQEKDEMNRLKELHKIASQERKLMLQKQRNMFNPQMSTKNILTKLKRSADCQSPRRLSGPMKGYDIRSNSSMSSLLESEKAQLDRAQIDMKMLLSDSSYRFEGKSVKSDLETSVPEKLDASNDRRYVSVLEAATFNELEQFREFHDNFDDPQTLESRTRKFEEKMPNSRTNYLLRQKHFSSPGQIIETHEETSQLPLKNVEITENLKSESDTLVEELSKKSKSLNHAEPQTVGQIKDVSNFDNIEPEVDVLNPRKSKSSQVNEDALLVAHKLSKKSEKIAATAEREAMKKSQNLHETKTTSKRKGTKNVKGKSSTNILTENILRSKNSASEEIVKSSNKRTKIDKQISDDNYQSSILEELDLNESQNSLQALVKHSRAVKDKNSKLLRDIASEHETKENIMSGNGMDKSSDNRDNDSRKDDNDLHNLGNISTRSQVSTFTISRHSSGDSEKSFSRSVVIRAQDHRFKTSKKLEEALNAREAALVARRNCVEDWIAWHTKLKAEECRIARMEQAAFKLVSTAANALSYHDTTVSSDTSDVEGRVELLAEKLAERRVEMAKLRRETRKQAKRRLKALELNLLNQIKKYDTTINEMQLKLETQKGAIRESDKLAIESRTVEDFKVPEIPLKRIQELYKSNDLLRSRSESDLILSKSLHDVTSKNSCTTTINDNENVCKSSQSRDSKNSRSSRLSSTRDSRTNQSAESVLEEAKKYANGNFERHSDSSSGRESQIASVTRSQESIESEDATNLRNITTVDGPETIAEGVKTSGSMAVESAEISEALQTIGTDGSSKLFSRKLESLQLTNKNLNDDISTLENDLKALSEMMSQFSKKSDDKLKFGSQSTNEQDEIVTIPESCAISTSRDISEELSRSVHEELVEEISRVPDDREILVSARSNDFIDKNSDLLGAMEQSRLSEIIESPKLMARGSDSVSAIIPEVDTLATGSSEQIDFEARSKEILNVIEKSIISEHVKSPVNESIVSDVVLEKRMMHIHEENETLSQGINSFDDDVKSISKIISEMSDSKRIIDVETSENLDKSEKYEKSHEESSNMPILWVNNENRVSTTNTMNKYDETINYDESQEKLEITNIEELQIVNFIQTKSSNKSDQESSERDKLVKLTKKIINEKIDVNVDYSSVIDEKTINFDDEASESIAEELSVSQHQDYLYNESSIVSRKSSEISHEDEATNDNRTNESSLENSRNENNEESTENDKMSIDKMSMDNEWTLSNSFQVADKPSSIVDDCEKSIEQETGCMIEPSEMSDVNFVDESREITGDRRENDNYTCDIVDVSMFIPKGESTTIGYRLEESINITKTDSMQTDELDDILDIIARESKQTDVSRCVPEIIVTNENEEETNFSQLKIPISPNDRIIPRPTDLNLTSEVEPVLQKLTEILQGVERNIALRRQKSIDSHHESPEISEALASKAPIVSPDPSESVVTSKLSSFDIEKLADQASDLETFVSEIIVNSVDRESPRERTSDVTIDDKPGVTLEETKSPRGNEENLSLIDVNEEMKTAVILEPSSEETIVKLAEKTFDILRDPEYEDISEESLEVSEILDRSESQRSVSFSRGQKIPEKYEINQKSEDVLRILDEISQKSYVRTDESCERHLHDVEISVQVFGSVSPGFTNRTIPGQEVRGKIIGNVRDDAKSVEIEILSLNDASKKEDKRLENEDELKYSRASTEPRDQVFRKRENDGSSESSEGADTPRGVSEIEMDSPRDPNESRLDIDALDDDLLSLGETIRQTGDGKVDFPVTTAIVTSEKDIETMIDKLKASLEQPGLEVAELEAKLLRIEQLQIELEIKKLEAEEVSYYMREIPNKPPPPYTPPGGVRLATPEVSPTLPPAVVPTNVEELTAFTEKATVLIFNAKNSGDDITCLQPPSEICELTRDNNETSKRDRRIYNTFLFDLCKETIAELYRSEYERPGPSWTKPNVKTKPAMKIPKNVDELNDYVSKEVATLFGFKTKLQRENMVMRWSRKRRDRVDELLAREAQAEEDEWTKFHHDELAVKNELTVAILDTLILETANVVKAVYAKKRKVA